MPVERFRWLPTRQPVVLDLWRQRRTAAGAPYTTITTWHNKGKDLDLPAATRYYWTKDREFEKFLDLPRRRPVPFELAAGVDDDVRQRLDASTAGGSADSVGSRRRASTGYRDYIQRSRGEFTVARDQYVRPRTGWFSDRSACYLAAGRPVITQETGFSKFLPTGQRPVRASRRWTTSWPRWTRSRATTTGNCRAAREIAAEYFAAEKVVGSLMERAGL